MLLQRDRLNGLLDELEHEAGPIDPQVMEDVHRSWPDPADSKAEESSA